MQEKDKTRRIMSGPVRIVPTIEKVIFNPPATVVVWKDGLKTVVKTSEKDEFSEEAGLSMAVAKRYFGNRSKFLSVLEEADRYE